MLAVEVALEVDQVGLDEQLAVVLERGPHADADRGRDCPSARPGVDARRRHDDRVARASGWRSACRARGRARRPARPCPRAGTARRAARAAAATSPRSSSSRMRRRGDGLAVVLDQRHDRRSRTPAAPRSSSASPRGAVAEAEVLPHADVAGARACRRARRRRTPPASSCENSSVNGITTSSSTPSSAIRSALTRGRASAAAAGRPGCSTWSGCGSNVTTRGRDAVRARPARARSPITRRWPRWTPSKVPTASARARRRAAAPRRVLRYDLHHAEQHRNRLQAAVTALGHRDQLAVRGQPTSGPLPACSSARLDRAAVPGAARPRRRRARAPAGSRAPRRAGSGAPRRRPRA